MLLLLAFSVAVSSDFPEPAGLEPNVSFWARVYGEWNGGQIAFHDRRHMGVVYSVLDLNPLGLHPLPADPVARRLVAASRRAAVDEHRAGIVSSLNALLRLNQRGKLDAGEIESNSPELLDLFRLLEEQGALSDLGGAAERLRAQNGLADRFYEGLLRYDMYRDVVTSAFVARNLPEDLVALAFVESLFHPTTVSHAGAAGMFQFMPATGREHGLARTPLWDLRRDPVLAADAAARMLGRNYQRLGNWPLALTGYNHGPNGVARGVQSVGSDDLMDLIEKYSSPSWGFASTNFYAQFLAARRTLQRRYELFGEWVPSAPWKMAEIRLPSPVSVSALVSRGCIDEATLRAFNSALLPAAFTGSGTLPSGFVLRVPEVSVARVSACAKVEREPDPTLLATTRDYTVAAGDTLSRIAGQHGVTIADLIEINELSADGLIRVGQVIRIPGRGPGARGAGGVGVARPEH